MDFHEFRGTFFMKTFHIQCISGNLGGTREKGRIYMAFGTNHIAHGVHHYCEVIMRVWCSSLTFNML